MLSTQKDPFCITPDQKSKYESQFFRLQPVNGVITGEQAKGLFLQSGLPPPVLAKIWELADVDADGRMDVNEFCIALHLIALRLKGVEPPISLPQSLRLLVEPPKFDAFGLSSLPPTSMPPTSVQPTSVPSTSQVPPSTAMPAVPAMVLTEWAIPQPSKLKYTQMFNTHDRTRTGFLTGPQARNILLQSGLPQVTLAQIWNLSDIDTDGRLTCEEFVLAMHLIDCVRAGDSIPAVLPLELVPPSLRRKRSLSGSTAIPPASVVPVADLMGPVSEDASLLGKMNVTTFEDKRRENFEKGQAELDRRRQLLLDQQRREQQERERKEREEHEKRERIRLEQEMRRQQELEKQMLRQKELEAEKEEQRRKLSEQREAARREMERQRLIEWENQRKQELQLQKQKMLESISLLKSKKTGLIIEVEKVNNQFNQVQEQVEDTRKKVADSKGEIDKMRYERDLKLKEINFLKAQMKTLQDRQLIIEQEKLNLTTQLKNVNISGVQGVTDSTQFALQSKQMTINQLKSQLEDAEKEKKQKFDDLENNNSQLNELKNTFNEIVKRTKALQETYNQKREEAMKLKEKSQVTSQDLDTGWADSGGWIEQGTGEKGVEHRAIFAFESRNDDELSVEVGDIVTVIPDPYAESGWVKGSCKGKTGWLPEGYLEQIDPVLASNVIANESIVSNNGFGDNKDAFKPSKDSSFITPAPKAISQEVAPCASVLTAVAVYPWKATKENHLSFNKGDSILVTEQQDMWWCGELNGKSGWFPKSYVKPLSAAGDELSATPEYYVSLYPFETQESGDLSFEAGELIIVMKKDGDWWTGEIGSDRYGIFPSNYVREAQPDEVPKPPEPIPSTAPTTTTVADTKKEPESLPAAGSVEASPTRFVDSPKLKKSKLKKPEVVKVIAAYKATGPEQLSLEKGQLIQVRKKNSSGWWEGEVQVKGKKRQIGWFPASYVKSLNPAGSGSGGSSARSTPDPTKSDDSAEKVIALYGFKAQHDDELSFEAEEIIKVITKDDPTWWKGQSMSSGAVGLFPSNHVQPYKRLSTSLLANETISFNGSNSNTNHSSRLTRQNLIEEFICTEDTYVNDLKVVIDVFRRPLVEAKVITSDEFDTIFLNWNELIRCNKSFLQDLKAVKRQSRALNSEISQVSHIFCRHIPNMGDVYKKFCSKQLNSALLLQWKHENNENFVEIEKRCTQDPRSNGLPLSTYLLKPMQRITKYPLLIKKILDYTAEGDPDFENCYSAYHFAKELCNDVNGAIGSQENEERLKWIQSHVKCDSCEEKIVFDSETNFLGRRNLIYFGYLIKVNSNKELVGFLFNDFLLLCEPLGKEIGKVSSFFKSEKALSSRYQIYKKPLFLDDINLLNDDCDISNSSSATENFSSNDPLVFILGITSLSRTFMLKATSSKDHSLWVQHISDCRLKFREAFHSKKAKRKSLHVNTGIGRLFVTVMEAVQLTSAKPVLDAFCILSVGSSKDDQSEHKDFHLTKVQRSLPLSPTLSDNPQTRLFKVEWFDSMQFFINHKPLDDLCLAISCYDKNRFSPNYLIGAAKLSLQDIDEELTGLPSGPIVKPCKLKEDGVIYLKLDIKYFED